jgi:hypothetical protein
MSKIYFSRSMTRTLSADHPVGDPTGGAAYGEKNDPVSAVLSMAAMYGSYAPMMAGSIMAGVTFAGAAVSLVGNVTGNKTLSKIGMVAGVIGGLGQMGAFGETVQNAKWGDTFGKPDVSLASTSGKSGSLSQTPTGAGNNLADEMADAQASAAARRAELGGDVRGTAGMPADGSSNAAFGAANRVPPTGADIADDIAGGGFQKINNPAGAGQTGSDWQYFKDASGNTAAIDPSGKYFLNGEQVTGAAGGKFGVSDYANMAWQGTKDFGAGVLNFAKDNPYAALAIGQVAQPIADYLSGKTDAEIDALEAQTGYSDAAALKMQEEIAREKQRRANLNAGYAQVNTGINVNPAVLGQAQAGGLISGAMQPAA